MGMTLVWNNEQHIRPIDDSLIGMLEQLLDITAQKEGLGSGEVALTLVDDETIRQYNKQYRGMDQATDVLSFSMRETTEDEPEIVFHEEDGVNPIGELLGDVVISVERALAQSEAYGHSFEREMGFLFVHGLLHLLGYDHDDETAEKEMFSLQETILRKAGLTR